MYRVDLGLVVSLPLWRFGLVPWFRVSLAFASLSWGVNLFFLFVVLSWKEPDAEEEVGKRSRLNKLGGPPDLVAFGGGDCGSAAPVLPFPARHGGAEGRGTGGGGSSRSSLLLVGGFQRRRRSRRCNLWSKGDHSLLLCQGRFSPAGARWSSSTSRLRC